MRVFVKIATVFESGKEPGKWRELSVHSASISCSPLNSNCRNKNSAVQTAQCGMTDGQGKQKCGKNRTAAASSWSSRCRVPSISIPNGLRSDPPDLPGLPVPSLRKSRNGRPSRTLQHAHVPKQLNNPFRMLLSAAQVFCLRGRCVLSVLLNSEYQVWCPYNGTAARGSA